MQQIILKLDISVDEYLKLYQGRTQTVRARSLDGRRVHFPAKILQPYVTRQGIHGLFRIDFDETGKFQRIERLPLG